MTNPNEPQMTPEELRRMNIMCAFADLERKMRREVGAHDDGELGDARYYLACLRTMDWKIRNDSDAQASLQRFDELAAEGGRQFGIDLKYLEGMRYDLD